MTTLQDTPRASRLHIGLFGRRNSGKSSLMNALVGQSLAVVSEKPGTTTDPVYKSMEISGIGPVVFIDTAGFDDDEQEAGLGAARVHQTERAAAETDIALVLFSPEADEDGDEEELAWVRRFQQAGKPVLAVIAQADAAKDEGHARKEAIAQATGCSTLAVSAEKHHGLEAVRREIARLLPEDYQLRSITGDLVGKDTQDLVLLVMPQDIQAPKGRLILPQVQTLRELLDKHGSSSSRIRRRSARSLKRSRPNRCSRRSPLSLLRSRATSTTSSRARTISWTSQQRQRRARRWS